MTLLSGTIQPPLLTLLSSTSDPPISPLFKINEDSNHPNDAFVTCLPDHESSNLSSSGSSKKRYVASSGSQKGEVIGQVIHIQSPEPRSTYIQAGSSKKGKGKAEPLGIELPWVGLQLKRLGKRGMSFEFGVVDAKGREGVIRISSYKTEPSVHLDRFLPLIHLPLQLPTTDQHTLTSWLDIKLNLASLLPLFKSLAPRNIEGDTKRRKVETDVPNEQFGYVSCARVYANCRLRRIWFSADGERTLDQARVKDEWALYACHVPS